MRYVAQAVWRPHVRDLRSLLLRLKYIRTEHRSYIVALAIESERTPERGPSVILETGCDRCARYLSDVFNASTRWTCPWPVPRGIARGFNHRWCFVNRRRQLGMASVETLSRGGARSPEKSHEIVRPLASRVFAARLFFTATRSSQPERRVIEFWKGSNNGMLNKHDFVNTAWCVEQRYGNWEAQGTFGGKRQRTLRRT